MPARRRLIASLAAFALALPAAASAAKPVRLVIEDGNDVGACADGATLAYPPEPYKAIAWFLVNDRGPLVAEHRALTASAPRWVKTLDGPSSANRQYVDAAGNKVLVFWACPQHECDTRRVEGARLLSPAPPAGAPAPYGLIVTDGPAKSTLGTLTPPLQAALACMRSIDDALRSRAAAAIKAVR